MRASPSPRPGGGEGCPARLERRDGPGEGASRPPARRLPHPGLLLALVLALAAPAQAAPPPIRIGLLRHAQPAALTLESPAAWRARQLTVPGGQPLSVRAVGATLTLTSAGSRAVAPSVRLEGPGPWTLSAPGVPERRYDGALTLKAANGRIVPVLSQPIERYVEGAVAGEMLPDWPSAALEAQAIASRSYALASTGRHRGEGYDVCDLTHCQRFVAARFIDPRHAVAVARTRGRRLVAGGRVAEALWHSTCGGHTASNEAVFGGAPRPYMRGVADGAWCQDSPHYPPWSLDLPRVRLERMLRAAGKLGPGEPLRDLSVVDRLAEGTVLAVRLVGERPREISGYAFWMTLGPGLGWGAIKSPAFLVTRHGDGFTLSGRGLGHRVGMCQWGARGRALAGHSARRILEAYYRGATIQ